MRMIIMFFNDLDYDYYDQQKNVDVYTVQVDKYHSVNSVPSAEFINTVIIKVLQSAISCAANE